MDYIFHVQTILFVCLYFLLILPVEVTRVIVNLSLYFMNQKTFELDTSVLTIDSRRLEAHTA